jgi:hypothetical protein
MKKAKSILTNDNLETLARHGNEELVRTLALDLLACRRSIKDWTDSEYRLAQGSYTESRGSKRVFTREIWERADPEGFRHWARAIELVGGSNLK